MAKKSSVHAKLGERIKSARLSRNMKIVDVAKEAKITSSMISQVERSVISPSIDTLRKISEVLDVPISHFFEDSDDDENSSDQTNEVEKSMGYRASPVVRKNQRKVLSPGPGVTFYLLNPNLSGPIEFIYNIYEPGKGTGHQQYVHVGYECGLILEGELVVQAGDKEYVLKEGDSISFSSEIPHSKTNKGDKRCVCIWANTPPFF